MTCDLLNIDQATIGPAETPRCGPISLNIRSGEILALLGPNGAGKSSLLRAVMGLEAISSGQVTWEGQPVPSQKPAEIALLGIGYVPEGRRVFPGLSVEENLMAVFNGNWHAAKVRMGEIWTLFPEILARRRSEAWRLSGGEQQMLAIGRALMRSPKLIMLDEPSLGLAPMAVGRTFDAIRKVRDAGTAVLISEQNTHHALEVADRTVVINRGQIVASGPPETFREPEVMTKLYLNH